MIFFKSLYSPISNGYWVWLPSRIQYYRVLLAARHKTIGSWWARGPNNLDKKQFFMKALQPNHQHSLLTSHLTNVSRVKGEPTSFNCCSKSRVKGRRFVENIFLSS